MKKQTPEKDEALEKDNPENEMRLSQRSINRFNIQTLTTEMELLKKREHQLAERLISEQPLVNELRKNPRFIKDADKVCLANLVDDVYNNFTSRLVNRFPNLTEVDITILYSDQASFHGCTDRHPVGYFSDIRISAEVPP